MTYDTHSDQRCAIYFNLRHGHKSCSFLAHAYKRSCTLVQSCLSNDWKNANTYSSDIQLTCTLNYCPVSFTFVGNRLSIQFAPTFLDSCRNIIRILYSQQHNGLCIGCSCEIQLISILDDIYIYPIAIILDYKLTWHFRF